MKPLSANAVKKLKLNQAILAEAESKRNLLPDEPGWDRVASHAAELADFAANRLRAGYLGAPQAEVAARKPGHGVRPVPFWGVMERIYYRALTDAALAGREKVDRSPEAYLKFVRAPIAYANELQKHDRGKANALFFFLESRIKYVVKSDVTAFYQFVDHGVLAEELLMIGADFELIETLLDLLSEVQGRSYGLPQLLDPSDELSEVYIDRVERALLRQGLAVWRFNDDFRIACETYSDALTAIEALDRAARNVGLVISEQKTVTVGFINYMFDVISQKRSDVDETISPDEVEDVVGDYTDDFGEEDADAALEVIERAKSEAPGDTGIDLRSIRLDDVRLLRRAINGLAKAHDPRGISAIFRLVVFTPSLMPTLMRYLTAVADGAPADAAAVVDDLIKDASQNDWQKLWVIDAMRSLNLLTSSAGDARAEWVRSTHAETRNPPLRAFATRALAAAGRLDV